MMDLTVKGAIMLDYPLACKGRKDIQTEGESKVKLLTKLGGKDIHSRK
jgi:hypothetical protein